MQLEVIREVAGAMGNASFGIATQLASLPRDISDSMPATPLIVDGSSDDAVVTGEQLERGKDIVVLVTPDGPTQVGGGPHGEYSYGSTPVAVTIVHRGSEMPATKLAQVEYVMRACVLALKGYFAQRDGRTRNEVTVLRATGLTYGLVQDDGLGALGALVFTIEALDKRAQRTH